MTGTSDTRSAVLQNSGLVNVALFPPAQFELMDLTFQNTGVLNLSSSPPSVMHMGTPDRAITFGNSGKIVVSANNTLVFWSGKSRDENTGHTELHGNLKVSAGDAVLFNVLVSEAASLEVAGGSLTIETASKVPRLKVTAGELRTGKTHLDVEELTIVDGIISIQETLTVSELHMSGGAIEGPGSMVVEQSWKWTGGSVEPSPLGSIEVLGQLILASSETKILGKNTVVKGNSTWIDGEISLLLKAVMVIEHNVVINAFVNQLWVSGHKAILENRGHLNFTTVTGTVHLNVYFNNYGDIDVHHGSLHVGASAIHQLGVIKIFSGHLMVVWSQLVLTNFNILLSGGAVKVRNFARILLVFSQRSFFIM